MKSQNEILNEAKMTNWLVLESLKKKDFENARDYFKRFETLLWVLEIKKIEDFIE